MFEQSRETEILKSIIDDTEYNKTPQSRNEEILLSILNDTEYTKTPQSREEELLLQLKDVIEDGKVIKHVFGNSIEFSDGADAPLVKCVTEIQGSQDLHGYDKPWVGGAGKNKLDDTYKTTDVNNAYYYSSNGILLRAGTYTLSCNIVINGIYVKSKPDDTTIFFVYDSKSLTFNLSEDKTVWFIFSKSNGMTASDFMLELGSTATAYAPYSNICPITAYTEGEIEVRGRNILDDSKRYYVGNAIYFGTTTSSSDAVVTLYPGTYTYKVQNVDGTITNLYMKDIITNANVPGFPVYNANEKTFTITEKITAIVWCYKPAYTSISDVLYAQLEKGSTATTYEPYTSTTHTTTFPNAIYRGSEDCVNGTVGAGSDGEMWLVADLGDLTWGIDSTYGSGGNRFRSDSITNLVKPSSSTELGQIICENYETVLSTETYRSKPGIAIESEGDYDHRIIIYDPATKDMTGAEFKTYVTGIKIAYRLATPTTSSVTPTNLPVKSLSGYNHISSTTGDMEIEYIKKDYQKFVDTVEKALPNTRKGGGIKAIDIFKSLVIDDEKEFVK